MTLKLMGLSHSCCNNHCVNCYVSSYDHSCDVWSLGCVLFDMATHSNKFICVSSVCCAVIGILIVQCGTPVPIGTL